MTTQLCTKCGLCLDKSETIIGIGAHREQSWRCIMCRTSQDIAHETRLVALENNRLINGLMLRLDQIESVISRQEPVEP